MKRSAPLLLALFIAVFACIPHALADGAGTPATIAAAWKNMTPMLVTVGDTHGGVSSFGIYADARSVARLPRFGDGIFQYDVDQPDLLLCILRTAFVDAGAAEARLAWALLPETLTESGAYTLSCAFTDGTGARRTLTCRVEVGQKTVNGRVFEIADDSVPLSGGEAAGGGDGGMSEGAAGQRDATPGETDAKPADPPPDEVKGEPETPIPTESAREGLATSEVSPAGALPAPDATQTLGYVIVHFMDGDGRDWLQMQIERQMKAEEPLITPSVDGCAFSHWFDLSGSVDAAYDFAQPVSADLWLRPAYEPASDAQGAPVVVTISADCVGACVPGAEVTLTAHVENAPEGVRLAYQWQVSEDGAFRDIPGATGVSYRFVIDAENVAYQWRVGCTMEE